MYSPNNISSFLQKHVVFSALNTKTLNKLSVLFEIHNYKQNELLVIEGNNAENFLILTQGAVRCFNITEEGNKKTYFILQAGAIILSDFITNMPHSYNIEAITPVMVITLNKDNFYKYIATNNNLLQALLKYSISFFAKEIQDIKVFSGLEAKERIIYYLLKNYILNRNFTLTNKNDIKIKLEIDKATLASNLDITPETLSRTLSKLESIGITNNKKTLICNIINLQKCCNLLLPTSYREVICQNCSLTELTKTSCNKVSC